MAKKKPYRKDQDPSLNEPSPLEQQNVGLLGNFPKERIPLLVLFVGVTFGSFILWSLFGRSPVLEEYTYEVQAKYPHDIGSFTQGLIHEDGFVYESTGKKGLSKIRKIDIKTGKAIKEKSLGEEFFGEGLCRVGDRLVQLTWKNNKGFVWDLDLNLIKEFEYEFEGWGLTYDGVHLIASDGTSQLRFMDPENFQVVKKIYVRKGNARMPGINELEYINGIVYANVYEDDTVYMISPSDGKVTGRINFQKLFAWRDLDNYYEKILNGIAIRKDNGNLLVTGKNWPHLFEVKLKPIDVQ